MKDQILKIAKVKSEKDFYKKYPTEEAFMAKHGKALQKAAMGTKMVNKQLKQLTDFSNPPIAADGATTPKFGFNKFGATAENPGGSFGAGAGQAGMAGLQNLDKIIGGIQAIGQQKKNIKKAEAASTISGLGLQAMAGARNNQKRQYVRPEDSLLTGVTPMGTGTNYLAANGAEIQNTYAPGNLYNDLGYEPLNDSNVKQFAYGGNLPTAEFGEYFQDSGQAQVGSAVGESIGSAFGPAGAAVGKLLGTAAGNLLGGAKDARKLKAAQDATVLNQQGAAFQGVMQNQFGANMENGGWMNPEYNPQMIAKFGEYNVKDLLKPPHDADMLRAGGHLKEYTPPSAAAMFTGRQMAMGGDLQVYRGEAEPISYNPYLPEGGETVMFRGPSHDDGGMPISYGQNGVEVEGGEPAVKLQDGGSPDGNLVVFGNMKIDDMAAREIGIDAAKGKKYKRFIDDLSKFESKQNKTVSKGTELVNLADTNDPFDQLTMNSGQAMIMGGNAKLQKAAAVKQNAAAVQNAILDTAKELGVKSDALAEGRLIKDKTSNMANFGAKMETAADGISTDPIYREKQKLQAIAPQNLYKKIITSKSGTIPYNAVPLEASRPEDNVYLAPTLERKSMATLPEGFAERAMASAEGLTPAGVTKEKKKINWGDIAETALSNISPFLRPTDQEGLDPSQLMGEQFALASNQLEPVQAQQFHPRLKEAYSVSLQDQLNEVDQQTRAAQRMAGNNVAAQAQIAAQAAEQKNKIRGEQMRINQGLQTGVYNENIAALNQAQLQNLQILDQQYVRQAQAKSNTKAQAQAALSSISAKIAQNKLENRQLGIYENLYNYRFGPQGQAINYNAPARFNIPDVTDVNTLTDLEKSKVKDMYEKIVSRDKVGNVTGTKEKTTTSKTNRNGSIVKALKNL